MTAQTAKYQGWTNYETWNIALWVNNSEPLYREMRALRPFTAQKARTLCDRFFPRGTRDFDRDNSGRRLSIFEIKARMKAVNWQEIADDFNAE